MACLWGMHRYRRKNGYCHIHDPEVFYLYVVHDIWLAGNCLPVCSVLDEHQKVYFECEEESTQVFIIQKSKIKSKKEPVFHEAQFGIFTFYFDLKCRSYFHQFCK